MIVGPYVLGFALSGVAGAGAVPLVGDSGTVDPGPGIGLVTATDLLDASTRTSLLDPTTDTGGAMAMVIDNGRDTPIDRVLRARRPNQVVDLVGADLFSRFVLHIGEVALDSAIIGLGDAQPFDNTITVTVRHEGKDVDVKMLRLQLGAQGLAPGTYTGKLVTYDADHPNGLVWDRGFAVKVIA